MKELDLYCNKCQSIKYHLFQYITKNPVLVCSKCFTAHVPEPITKKVKK